MNRSVSFVLACLVVAATSPFAAADTPEEKPGTFSTLAGMSGMFQTTFPTVAFVE